MNKARRGPAKGTSSDKRGSDKPGSKTAAKGAGKTAKPAPRAAGARTAGGKKAPGDKKPKGAKLSPSMGAGKGSKLRFVKGEVTLARGYEGREKILAHTDREPLWLRIALDAIARQRATGEPLDRVLHVVEKEVHAGQRERRESSEAAFGWARQRGAVEGVLDDAIAAYGGTPPRRRDRDRAALILARLAASSEGEALDEALWRNLPEPLVDVLDDAAVRGAAVLAGRAPFPAWLVERLKSAHGASAGTLLEALSSQAPLTLAIDVTKTSIDDVIAALDKLGAKAERSPVIAGAVRVTSRLSLAKLPKAIAAHVWPMDDGSQLVAHAVGAKPGERVLDLCAGGGGKTRLLSQTGAHVVAVDLHRRRLQGTHGASVVADGIVPPFAPGSFDRVLVDAPCTGTGTLRRAPDLAARLSEGDIAALAKVQQALLASAASLVKPGGIVVYATCSLLPEENEAIARGAPASLEPVSLGALWGRSATLPMTDVPQLQLLPSVHGTDGFFLAAFRRRA